MYSPPGVRPSEFPNATKVNGNPAIMLSIEKQTGYSTGDVTKRIKTRFEEIIDGRAY